MGGYMCKNCRDGISSAANSMDNNQQCRTDLETHEADDRVNLLSFGTALQARTGDAINALAAGAEVRALSFDSLRGVTECLLQMNQEVVRLILDCKEDIWKNQELFALVGEYFDNSLRTMDFCVALEKCLKTAKDNQLLVHAALLEFEEEGSTDERYAKTLDELKNFKNAGDPFTEEFFGVFQSVHGQQMVMLERLQLRKKKLDKKLKCLHSWRKVSRVIFAATVTALIICSAVAAAMAAPHVTAALAAASSVPLGSMGKWIDSLIKNYESVVKGQKEIVNCMSVGTYVAIKDLENIRVLIDRLEVEIESLMVGVDLAINEESVKVGVEEVRKKLVVFEENVDELGKQVDVCSRDVRQARTVILQRIIKHTN